MTALAASRVAISPLVTELSFLCTDGMKLAAQRWALPTPSPPHPQSPTSDHVNGNSNKATVTPSAAATTTPTTKRRRILCLHGWMDNCRSFSQLAPSLLQPNEGDEDDTLTEIIALDFPGHGLSSHKSADGPPMMVGEAAFYVHEAVTKLEWDTFALIGHSMGSAVGLLYAASFPERVDKLILLEGAGPMDRKARDVTKHARAHIQRRQIGNEQMFGDTKRAPRIYPSLDMAVQTRCKTAENFPGKQWLSTQAAQEMVLRAVTFTESGGVQFRHDPRLQWPSLQYYTWEQVEAMYQDLQAPTCILLAENGWPLDKDKLERAKQLMQPNVMKVLPGSHHFHADPDTAKAVIEQVKDFLKD